MPDMPFLRETFGNEPASNFGKQEMLRTPGGHALDSGRGSDLGSFNSVPESLRKFSDGASLRKFFFSVHSERPSDEHDIHDIEYNAVRDSLWNVVRFAMECCKDQANFVCIATNRKKDASRAFFGSAPTSTTGQDSQQMVGTCVGSHLRRIRSGLYPTEQNTRNIA